MRAFGIAGNEQRERLPDASSGAHVIGQATLGCEPPAFLKIAKLLS